MELIERHSRVTAQDNASIFYTRLTIGRLAKPASLILSNDTRIRDVRDSMLRCHSLKLTAVFCPMCLHDWGR